MRGKELLVCMEYIHDEFVEEAMKGTICERTKVWRNVSWKKWGAAAACAAVLCISFVGFRIQSDRNYGEIGDIAGQQEDVVMDNNSMEKNAMELSVDDSAAADAYTGGPGSKAASGLEEMGMRDMGDDIDNVSTAEKQEMAYGDIQRFSYRLFNETVSGEDGNPVISPVSAYLALSMAGLGADGNTRAEFQDVLGAQMETVSGDIMNSLCVSSDDLTLSLANSAWIDTKYLVDENWLGMIRSVMDAEAFSSELSSVDTMDSMNRWVSDRTNGLIENMVEEPLSGDMRLVLFNTLYFHAKWSDPFESFSTRAEDFFLAGGRTVKADMMQKYEQLDYIENGFAEGVILPYTGDGGTDLAFIALKPKKGMDSLDLENFGSSGYVWELTGEMVSELLDSRQTKLVNLKLPKFEITFDREFNKMLRNMGLNDCFDPDDADFGRMGKTVNGDNLFISLVRQKAKIIVDEKGTEAAAVTEIAMRAAGSAMRGDPVEVYFDEPFLYMIMDMDKEIPLFIGILDNPAAD